MSEKVAPPASAAGVDNSPQLSEGIDTMVRYAINNGLKLPDGVVYPVVAMPEVDKLALYNTLVDTIKPATVESIQFINRSIIKKGSDVKVDWYRVPIFTKCIIIAVLALLILIGVSLSPTVNQANLSEGLLNSEGSVLLVNLVFVCSASLLGVMFYLLKTISDKIKNYTLLPIDSIEINTTILIGMISGFIISELFTFDENALGGSVELQKMTLALLGGFSSDAIFTVLQGIVNKAKSFLTPGGVVQ